MIPRCHGAEFCNSVDSTDSSSGGRRVGGSLMKIPLIDLKTKYSTGTTYKLRIVERIMPPSAVVPSEWRLFAPAPSPIAIGKIPKTNASDVIIIQELLVLIIGGLGTSTGCELSGVLKYQPLSCRERVRPLNTYVRLAPVLVVLTLQ